MSGRDRHADPTQRRRSGRRERQASGRRFCETADRKHYDYYAPSVADLSGLRTSQRNTEHNRVCEKNRGSIYMH